MSQSPATSSIKELTIRGIIIGGIITVVFTAANVYLGLKVGITFATSIPAAVISMAILRRFADHTVQENNIVQTIASAAGTLSSIIFVLPGLIIIGWWSGFPYWTTVFIIILGGILGVTYSIPLRRALVTHSDLPYPEGVAGAEVLRVGDTTEGAEESQQGFRMILRGSLASAGLSCPSCRLSRLSGWRSPASSRSARVPPCSARRCPWPSSAWGIWSASPSASP